MKAIENLVNSAKVENIKKSTYSEYTPEAFENYLKKAAAAKELAKAKENESARPSFVEFNTNDKLNGVISFGTLPVIDCGKACKECKRGCYAIRHQAIYKEKLNKMGRNSARLELDRDAFFNDIQARANLTRVLRWHESGEVKDMDYFARFVEVCKNTPYCEHLLFTKRFDIVNAYIAANGELPRNARVILSAWRNIAAVENPYNLPISAPDFSNAPAKYREEFNAGVLNILECGGNCFECFAHNTGCFGAQGGDVIKFIAH